MIWPEVLLWAISVRYRLHWLDSRSRTHSRALMPSNFRSSSCVVRSTPLIVSTTYMGYSVFCPLLRGLSTWTTMFVPAGGAG